MRKKRPVFTVAAADLEKPPGRSFEKLRVGK